MTNELNDIVAKFRTWYPDCPPLGWHIRDRFIDRWCRIDNLPGRTGLAKTPEEMRSALHRNIVVATEALGEGNRCAAIMQIGGREPFDDGDTPWVAKLGATTVEGWPEARSDQPVHEDELHEMGIAVAFCEWRPKRFEELILDVATDRETLSVVFVALDTGRAYFPWDGGADVFVEDMPTAHALWDKYLAMGWTPSELYTGKPPNKKFSRGFPYEWRTLPWDDERNP